MRPYLVLLLLLPSLAHAHEGVRASGGWAPPSLSQPNGVGFVTLNASRDDALLGVSSDCCEAVEIHTHTMDGDVMRMRRVDAIALPDHQDVTLQPGGYHIMLIGLKEPLKDGAQLPVTLTFKHADPVDTTLDVSRAKLTESLNTPRDHSHH